MARRQISEERKAVYYIGMVLAILGFLVFGSVFLTAPSSSTDFESFDAQSKVASTSAILGMGMILVGFVLMGIGSRGLAGSGVVLDPEKAREDVEPWARMAGGVVKDAVDEAGVDLSKLAGAHDEDLPFDEKLRRLHKLLEDGLVTEQEYEAEKAKILENA